jgi:cysteine-rich repeat protein
MAGGAAPCSVRDHCEAGVCVGELEACGDGVLQASCSEECDDGNRTAGGIVASDPCTDDGNPCTLDVCNLMSTCAHPAGHAGAVCRPAAGACDMAEVCDGTHED